ncbi:unnamed protein product [Caenorhabditis bovis]|uniref:Uncharacterized protein n=1 Tax=Caenorhabditis bovis TaxID=2654633 RepID=A0A8S1EFK6_9PELO|nr:unnamed protein product [Caenorhabditis bovis]
MRLPTPLILLIGLTVPASAQFGEIASLATSLLGGALGNAGGLGALAGAGAGAAGAAGQAGGALAQIGQLYQLAQGALQLTGTGVGVLNQASEGNWFPAVLEQAAKNHQSLMKPGGGNGLNLGALGPKPGGGNSIGPEFGTSFPAPDIDDYDENANIPGISGGKSAPKPPDGLIDIDSGDYEIDSTTVSTTTEESTTETATLFPTDEEEESSTEFKITTPPARQIHIQLPDKNAPVSTKIETDEEDYEDLIKKDHTDGKPEIVKPEIDAESEQLKTNVIATHGAKTQPIVPKLDKLLEVLQKSKLSKQEIDEIVSQVESNKRIEKPPKYDFNSAVQNIPDKKNKIREKITVASRAISERLETERNANSKTIETTVNQLKVVPDFAQTTQTPVSSTQSVAHVSSRHVPQTRSATPLPAPPVAVATNLNQVPTIVQKNVAPQYPAYNQQYQQFRQQAYQHPYYYYNQAPYYGQQTQNYWGQQNNYQQQVQQSQQVQQGQYYNQQQFSGQPYTAQPYYQQYQGPAAQTTQQHLPQQLPPKPVQQPAQVAQSQYQQPSRVPVNAPTLQQQTVSQYPVQQRAAPQLQVVKSDTNHVVHYYHNGKVVVQQLIPKSIAVTGSFPINGPFQSNSVGSVTPPNPQEYARTQRALQQAYQQPQTRSISAQAIQQQQQRPVAAPAKAVYKPQVPGPTHKVAQTGANLRNSVLQPPSRVHTKVYEKTIVASSNRQAHAIRTFQASQPEGKPAPAKQVISVPRQSSAAVRSSGRTNNKTSGKPVPRISGHVLPGPTIDNRSLLEKRTTAKPRTV